MCGRFDLHTPPSRWAALLSARADPVLDTCVLPSTNVPPGRTVLIAVADPDGTLHLGSARWGLTAPWPSRTGRPPLIFNARAETIATKAPFRHLVGSNRCLIPADAFYEWRHESGPQRRLPFAFTRADGAPLTLAGLWQPDGAGVDSGTAACTIITTEAGPDVIDVHHRMPVVLDGPQGRCWLSGSAAGGDPPDAAELRGLLRPAEAGTLVAQRVPPLGNRTT